jgi:hypothetical protein
MSLGAIALLAMVTATFAADSDSPSNDPGVPSYQRSPNSDSTLPPQYQYSRSATKSKSNSLAPPKGEPKASPAPTTDRKVASRDSVTRTSATFDSPTPNQAPPRAVNRTSYPPSYSSGSMQPSYRGMSSMPSYRSAAAESVAAPQPTRALAPPGPRPVVGGNQVIEMEGQGYHMDGMPPHGDAYGIGSMWEGEPGYGGDPSCCGECDNCCGPCDCWSCGKFDFSSAYLIWWGKGSSTPPLVTTSPQGTARNLAGVLGQPTTTILFGNDEFNDEVRSGVYVKGDYWFSCDHCVGIEATYLLLGEHDEHFNASSNGDPILVRPFFNTVTGAFDNNLIAFPNVFSGSIHMTADTGLQGSELLLRNNWFRNCWGRLDFLAGYRWLQLRDDLRMSDSATVTGTDEPIPVGTKLDAFDDFGAHNTFNGFDFGFATQWRHCRWSLDMLTKIAIGSTESDIGIHGTSTVTEPNTDPVHHEGGLLALQSNIGDYHRSVFSMVPEIGATVGYDLTCRLRLTAGYTLIYWSRVSRANDQVDLALNPNEFPPPQTGGSPSPLFRFISTDYWAQGVNLGADFRF